MSPAMPRVRSAIRGFWLVAGWACVATVVAAFFLPWARFQINPHGLTRVSDDLASTASFQELAQRLSDKVGRVVVTVQRGAETTTGQLSDLSAMPSEVAGVDIPRLARREDARLLAAVGGVLAPTRGTPETWRARSAMVYLVPILAVVVGLLMTGWRRRLPLLALGALCLGIAGAGWWRLSVTAMDTFLATVRIGPGLWMSCLGYAGLGLAAIGLGLWTRDRDEDRHRASALA